MVVENLRNEDEANSHKSTIRYQRFSPIYRRFFKYIDHFGEYIGAST